MPPITPSPEELQQLFDDTYKGGLRDGYTTVQGFVLPNQYHKLKKQIDDFEVFDSDVWICGFPKTGTTWISEIAWLITNDFDYEGAKLPDYLRTRMLEFTMLFDEDMKDSMKDDHYFVDSVGHSKNQKHPRTIKSHLPLPLLPSDIAKGKKRPKIIYTARNPMDTCISYYHQCKNYEGFTGSVDAFCKLFLYDKVNYTPYAAHVLTFWEQRYKPNILFVTYEEMKKDLPGVITKVGKLLGKTVSAEQSKRLQEYVSFDSMKKNPAVNKEGVNKTIQAMTKDAITPFIRTGKTGGYRNVMSSGMIEEFRYWMEKKFEGSGLNLLDD